MGTWTDVQQQKAENFAKSRAEESPPWPPPSWQRRRTSGGGAAATSSGSGTEMASEFDLGILDGGEYDSAAFGGRSSRSGGDGSGGVNLYGLHVQVIPGLAAAEVRAVYQEQLAAALRRRAGQDGCWPQLQVYSSSRWLHVYLCHQVRNVKHALVRLLYNVCWKQAVGTARNVHLTRYLI